MVHYPRPLPQVFSHLKPSFGRYCATLKLLLAYPSYKRTGKHRRTHEQNYYIRHSGNTKTSTPLFLALRMQVIWIQHWTALDSVIRGLIYPRSRLIPRLKSPRPRLRTGELSRSLADKSPSYHSVWSIYDVTHAPSQCDIIYTYDVTGQVSSQYEYILAADLSWWDELYT